MGPVDKVDCTVNCQNTHTLSNGTAKNSRSAKQWKCSIQHHSKNNDALHQHQLFGKCAYALTLCMKKHVDNTCQDIKCYSNTENGVYRTPKASIQVIGHADSMYFKGNLLLLDNKEIDYQSNERNAGDRIAICLQCS